MNTGRNFVDAIAAELPTREAVAALTAAGGAAVSPPSQPVRISVQDHTIPAVAETLESNARTYARHVPALEKGLGSKVYGLDGREFIDCLAGAGSLATGHNHPHVIARMKQLLDSGHILLGLDIGTPTKDAFTKKLFSVLPPAFRERARIQFCGPTGADAAEAAIKLFKIHTGREALMAFHGAYHGMSAGALAMTGNLTAKSRMHGGLSNVHFLPYPYAYRCPFGVGEGRTNQLSLNYIESVLGDVESGIPKPAALFVECVQGEGGCIPAEDEWLRGLRALTLAFEVPLVVDEVQTGFGRTGSMFAFERAGITPDAVMISKAIGGGLPFSALLYDRKYDTWSPGSHAGTFRGNQLAMAAGIATLEVIEREGLIEGAARKGDVLLKAFRELAMEFPFIGDVRGRGLMVGLELVDRCAPPDRLGRHRAAPGLAAGMRGECARHGLIVETGGRHGAVVRFLPPLVITDAEIAQVIAIVKASAQAVARSAP
jgi:diaminobutyrate-2-oxoglutarate transaminase